MVRKNKINLIVIAVLAFFGFNLVFPQYINKAINFIKPKIDSVPIFNQLPQFPEIPFKLGLDLQGGSRLIYEADLSAIKDNQEKEDAMQGLRDVIERRINIFGIAEPVVSSQKQGESQRLSVELPGIKNLQQAIEMIGKTPYLEFKEEPAGATEPAPGTPLDQYFLPTKLTGQYLEKATVVFNDTTYKPEVAIEFNDQGSEIFKELTAKTVGRRLAIFIDGVLISAPKVNEAISGGKAQITGDFTADEARDLARNLNAGALPVPIKLIAQNTVGPTLGMVSLKNSLVAGILGFIGVCLFMIIFYRFPGFLSVLALIFYTLIVLCFFKLIPVTLTLAGIGGVILSIGMAVDANVLIFERFKEERQRNESFEKALETGFKRAWPSIRDSNLTTLLVALIMFSFGTSFVKGFAVALSIGIIISMLSALLVTKALMKGFIGTRLEKIRLLWGG